MPIFRFNAARNSHQVRDKISWEIAADALADALLNLKVPYGMLEFIIIEERKSQKFFRLIFHVPKIIFRASLGVATSRLSSLLILAILATSSELSFASTLGRR